MEGAAAEVKRLRAFIAVELSDPIKASLGRIQDSFRRLGDRVGWVKPAGMHLTLKFLGEIEEKMVSPVGKEMAGACADRRPFPLHLAGTGLFPGSRNPRVLWVGIREGAEEVRSLFRRLDPLLEEIGFPREERDFHPHITLGRIKSFRDRRRFMAHAAEKRKVEVGTMTVESIHLIESCLHPDGAEYRVRLTASLNRL